MPFEKELKQLEQKRKQAQEMGGRHKVDRQHARGRLSARERIEHLLDPGSFMDICQDSCSKGIGDHRLANWPTKF